MTLIKRLRTYQLQTVHYQCIFHVFRFLLLAFTSNFSPFCSRFQFVMHVKSFIYVSTPSENALKGNHCDV